MNSKCGMTISHMIGDGSWMNIRKSIRDFHANRSDRSGTFVFLSLSHLLTCFDSSSSICTGSKDCRERLMHIHMINFTLPHLFRAPWVLLFSDPCPYLQKPESPSHRFHITDFMNFLVSISPVTPSCGRSSSLYLDVNTTGWVLSNPFSPLSTHMTKPVHGLLSSFHASN